MTYTQISNVNKGLPLLATGGASFVSLDGGQDDSIVPAGTLQLPVAGHALMIVYNIPGVPSGLVCFHSVYAHT